MGPRRCADGLEKRSSHMPCHGGRGRRQARAMMPAVASAYNTWGGRKENMQAPKGLRAPAWQLAYGVICASASKTLGTNRMLSALPCIEHGLQQPLGPTRYFCPIGVPSASGQRPNTARTATLQKEGTHVVDSLLRCLAESNRLAWFCRPLPNRSDKAPCPFV